MTQRSVIIDYTNHRGQKSQRRIIPIMIGLSATEWHPDEQWLLQAWDLDKRADRTFAMKDIHGWKPDDQPLTSADFHPHIPAPIQEFGTSPAMTFEQKLITNLTFEQGQDLVYLPPVKP